MAVRQRQQALTYLPGRMTRDCSSPATGCIFMLQCGDTGAPLPTLPVDLTTPRLLLTPPADGRYRHDGDVCGRLYAVATYGCYTAGLSAPRHWHRRWRGGSVLDHATRASTRTGHLAHPPHTTPCATQILGPTLHSLATTMPLLTLPLPHTLAGDTTVQTGALSCAYRRFWRTLLV